MVILFPSNIQSRNGARPTMPKIVPVKEQHIWPQTVFCPPINYTTSVSMQPPPCTPLPRIVQVPGQISIRKNVPVTVHVLKFSLALNTTVRAPTPNTVNMVIQPKKAAPSASEVENEPPGEQARECMLSTCILDGNRKKTILQQVPSSI
jgi:hypothetical protein